VTHSHIVFRRVHIMPSIAQCLFSTRKFKVMLNHQGGKLLDSGRRLPS
jgi:hypothetical protein